MKILDKTVPLALVSVLNSNWRDRINLKLWQELFPDEVRAPWLYSLNGIKGETKSFLEDYHEQVLSKNLMLGGDFRTLFDDDVFWFGRKVEGVHPGFVDARNVLIIGEIGLEMMIGLDYSKSQENPSVIYFNNSLLWVEVSPNLELFLKGVEMI